MSKQDNNNALYTKDELSQADGKDVRGTVRRGVRKEGYL